MQRGALFNLPPLGDLQPYHAVPAYLPASPQSSSTTWFFFFLTFCHPSHSVVTFQPLELTSIVQIWAGGPESNRTSTCITSSYCMPRQCHNRHPCFSHFHIVYCICHAVGMMAWSKSQQDGSWNKSKFVSCLCKCLV